MARGRNSRLTEPGFIETLADLYARGLSREAIAQGIAEATNSAPPHVDSITVWCRDERVRQSAEKIVRDRALSITRKIDSAIEGRLDHLEKLTTKELLDIRSTLAPAKKELTISTDKARIIEELWARADEDPALAAALAGLLGTDDN